MVGFLGLDGPFRQPAGCVIESAPGKALRNFHGVLTRVNIDTSRNKAATATLSFTAPVDENDNWFIQDSEEISVGQTLIISARFSPLEVVPIFDGLITSLSPSYTKNRGEAAVEVQCKDKTVWMDREFRKRSWSVDDQMDDVRFVTDMAALHGLTADPDNQNGLTQFPNVQNNTDAGFMYDRACRSDYEFYIRDNKIYFGPLRLSADPQPNINIYAGHQTNCLDFQLNHSGTKADKIMATVATESGDSVEQIEVQSDLDVMGPSPAQNITAPLGENILYMTRNRTPHLEDAEKYALAHANREAMNRITATGELDSTLYAHILKVGLPVGVSGGGKTYSGRYYVDSVVHDFSHDGYKQKFSLIRNGIGDDLDYNTSVLAGIF